MRRSCAISATFFISSMLTQAMTCAKSRSSVYGKRVTSPESRSIGVQRVEEPLSKTETSAASHRCHKK